MSLAPEISARLKRNDAGLVAAVAQERSTGDVLMVAWMDDEALARTLETREATYFSRSRNQHWVKGETSGHTQYVHEVRLDHVARGRGAQSCLVSRLKWVNVDELQRDIGSSHRPLLSNTANPQIYATEALRRLT